MPADGTAPVGRAHPVADVRRPKVIVSSAVEKRWDLAGVTSLLLDRVPPDAILGLDAIVYRDAGSLPRRERRRTTISRGRKVLLPSSLGFYQPGDRGRAPIVEIHADRLYACVPPGLRWVRAVQEMTVAHVLFHEIGHHIHRTKRPRFAEVEEEAERWRRRLVGHAFDADYVRDQRLEAPFLAMAAASPGLVGLWGLEFVERHYRWVLLAIPALVPFALYLALRRLVVAARRILGEAAA